MTIFNEPTLTAKLPKPRGAPICVMERSLAMAGPLGSFLSADGSALQKGCKYFMLDLIFLFLTYLSRTELEGSVKNYKGTLFHCCSSIVEGNIKLQLFIQHITKLFVDTDLFSEADLPITQSSLSAGGSRSQGDLLTQSAMPFPIPGWCRPCTPRVTRLARLDVNHGLAITPSICVCHLGTPHAREGWYVVYHGAIPGIYQGL